MNSMLHEEHVNTILPEEHVNNILWPRNTRTKYIGRETHEQVGPYTAQSINKLTGTPASAGTPALPARASSVGVRGHILVQPGC